MTLPHGKYMHVDPDAPEAVGICDLSGFPFPRSQLHKQMVWRGDRIVWSGTMRGARYLDPIDPQDKPKRGGTDPEPLTNTRPDDAGSDGNLLYIEMPNGDTYFLSSGDSARTPSDILWSE